MNDIIRTLQFEKEQLEAKNRLLQEKIESDNRQISEYDHELRQAKKLLKAAVEDLNCTNDCVVCMYVKDNNCPDDRENCGFKWRYADEALKLIES